VFFISLSWLAQFYVRKYLTALGEGPVDHRRTIAEIESEETGAFSRRKVLGIARSQLRKNAHGAIQLAGDAGDALPSPQPSPQGEGASKKCLDLSCAVASMASMASFRKTSPCEPPFPSRAKWCPCRGLESLTLVENRLTCGLSARTMKGRRAPDNPRPVSSNRYQQHMWRAGL